MQCKPWRKGPDNYDRQQFAGSTAKISFETLQGYAGKIIFESANLAVRFVLRVYICCNESARKEQGEENISSRYNGKLKTLVCG